MDNTHSLTCIAILLFGILFIGCSDEDNPTNSLPEPFASFTYNGTMFSPAAITFVNRSRNADQYVWDFGDGRTSTTENPTHTFAKMGVYQVKLTCSDTQTGKSSNTFQFLSIDPGKAFLDSLILEDFPFVSASGSSWDIGSGPEVYWDIEDPDYNHLYTSTIKYDVTRNALPLRWIITSHVSIPLNGEIGFWFYDEDFDGFPEYIAAGSLDLQADYQNGIYAESYHWSNDQRPFKMRIYLHWE